MARFYGTIFPLIVSLSLATACGKKTSFARDESTKSQSTDTPTGTSTDTSTNTKTGTDTSVTSDDPTRTETSVITDPKCSLQENVLRGAHILLLVDNSTSMQQTDCPSLRDGQCGGKTAREQTVMDIVQSLQNIENSSKDKDISRSSIAIAQFTVDQAGDAAQYARDLMLNPTWATQVNNNALQRQIQRFKQPYGDTPYRNAVQLAQQLRDRVKSSLAANDTKPVIAVMITDGEPTDRNPAKVRDLASAFKASGVKWYSVMVNPATDRQQRLAVHHDIMLGYQRSHGPSYGGNWFDTNYSAFEAYWTDLIALPGQVADKEIQVPSAALMSPAIMNEVISKEIVCVKPPPA